MGIHIEKEHGSFKSLRLQDRIDNVDTGFLDISGSRMKRFAWQLVNEMSRMGLLAKVGFAHVSIE